MKHKPWKLLTTLTILVLVVTVLAGCGSSEQKEPVTIQLETQPTAAPEQAPAADVSLQPPPAALPAPHWPTSPPGEQGMRADLLSKMVDDIKEQDYDVHSITIVRNGYLVMDEYLAPFDADSKHIICSCSQSIISALIGIAIEQGHIAGVDQYVLDLFPGRTAANLDANKQTMTLEHLLTMSSGLRCRDSYLYDWRGLGEMLASDDWVQHVLDLPMAEAPGTRFEYCNGGSFLLSALIQETTGKSALEYAREHLFGSLGITDVDWPANPDGIMIAWGDVRLKPHDGAGDVDVASLTAGKLVVRLNGAGDVSVGSLAVDELMVHLNGAGDVELAGQALEQGIFLNGVGDYRAAELESQTAIVQIDGIGTATVWATAALDARVSGPSTVEYYGNPQVTQDIARVGRLVQLGNHP